MITKTVFAFDPVTKAYVGIHLLDEGDLSPLDSTLEEPVWLLPGNCLETEPPEAPEGQWPFFVDGEWAFRQLPSDPAQEPQPEPTLEERAAVLLAGVDVHLNAAARAMRYDDIRTAVTYADEPAVPKFQAEGQALRAWRSLVYAKCYEVLAKVQAGEIEEPTLVQLISMLPDLQLPA